VGRRASGGARAAVNRGDIYLVSFDPTKGHAQQGYRPVFTILLTDFNEATKLPVVLPITSGGAFARRIGVAVSITGIRTSGVVRSEQPRVVDLNVRNGRNVDALPQPTLDEVLAKTIMPFA
jgi:mRNA interferase ChpB